MKYTVAAAVVFSALASGQNAPNHFQLPETLASPTPNLLQQRLQSMTLLNGLNATPAKPPSSPLRVEIVGKTAVCAVPLLNAMPANSGTAYKMKVLTPYAGPIDPRAVTPGIPVCSQKH